MANLTHLTVEHVHVLTIYSILFREGRGLQVEGNISKGNYGIITSSQDGYAAPAAGKAIHHRQRPLFQSDDKLQGPRTRLR